jgi:hypothetical protein
MENGPESGVLMLCCLATGEPVHTGVRFNTDELAAIRSEKMRVHCPVCGGGHGFNLSDAWIAKAN